MRFIFSYLVDYDIATNTRIYLLLNGPTSFYIGIGECVVDTGQVFDSAPATWQHLAMSWQRLSPALGEYRVYLDGVEVVSSGSYTPNIVGPPLSGFDNYAVETSPLQMPAVGRFVGGGGGYYFDGYIDEFRMSSAVRSADWLRAQYLSMTNGFLSFGVEQSN